jgi:hypothetical protein
MCQQRCVGLSTGAAPPQQGVGQLTDALPGAHVVRAYAAADRASARRTIHTEWEEG